MINANSISEEQKVQIQSWADDGIGLSEIQRRLASELDVKATYMETRFLIEDLGIKMPEEETPEPADEPESSEESEESEESGESGEPEESADDLAVEAAEGATGSAGSIEVTISELQRPGAMVNGTVTYAGGETADWWMDQMGQLRMDPRNPEFRPSESDMMDFQKELQAVAKEKGL